jgi:hypothetical protein
MVLHQEYRVDEEESPSASFSEVSLWCEHCVARHYCATALLQIEEAPLRFILPN